MEEIARAAQPLAERLRPIKENSSVVNFQRHLRAIEESMGARTRDAMRLLEETSSVKSFLDTIAAHQELARTTFGPMWELRQAGLFETEMTWPQDMEVAKQAIEGFELRFHIPENQEISRLVATFETNPLSEVMERYGQEISTLQRAMEGMRSPWLDAQEAMRSIAGFAEVQGIGQVLHTMPAFDENLAAILRTSLGDWRDEIRWQPEVFNDLALRGDFYVGLGFNPALTDFTVPAFRQGLEMAGLRRELPVESEVEDDAEEGGLARTNAAHDRLQRMERKLRKFVDEQKTRSFGEDWFQHRLPNGIYDDWREKKRKAEDAGAEKRPLIEYADFTRYAPIICKKDNWRELFKPFFGREESIRESFQRLHPIRLDIAHARLITQDDELLLCVEVKRLVKVIC